MFNKKLKEELKRKEEEIYKLKRDIKSYKSLKKDNKALINVNVKVVEDINKLKKEVRDQNEADLFFAAAKIQKELLEGKKKEEVANTYEEIERLRCNIGSNLLAQQQQYYRPNQSLFSGLLGGAY